ncbi:hypothetical protein, partial [Streptosporangium saharense]|uniref:hypothetical protein n=1 Tax=Streptosporangium saharense TaxID=1706840 RepID=UPI00331C8B87
MLVGGHERGHVAAAPEGLEGARAVAVGRELYALTLRPAVVVPLTLGRDMRLVAQIAQVLRWNGRGREPGELLLAPPLGTAALSQPTRWAA